MGFFNKASLGYKMVNCEDLVEKTLSQLMSIDNSSRNTKNLVGLQIDDSYRNSITKILRTRKDIDRMFLKEKGNSSAIPASEMDRDYIRISGKIIALINFALDMESRYNINLVNEYYI